MAHGILIHRPDSSYDDLPEERYQFPSNYLSRMRAIEGEWFAYYAPASTGARGYFAVARLAAIEEDLRKPGLFLARVEPGSYLELPKVVPVSVGGRLIESTIDDGRGNMSGGARVNSVRHIGRADFSRLLDAAGLDEAPLPRTEPTGTFREPQAPFVHDEPRDRRLASRAVRDGAFRERVVSAYDGRCAVTGLRLVNGGGRLEVEAAHIRPVADGGPDSVRNAMALSGTAHWMFDRGLIGVGDDGSIRVSRQVNDRSEVERVVNATRFAIWPAAPHLRPHPRYLEWHREHVFKN